MGPLQGVTVKGCAGIGPGPFCGMMLADMGAKVIRIDRPGSGDFSKDVLCRSRQSIAIDLKSEAGKSVALDLISKSDALIEGFRPGVMERLGLGPEICLEKNPALVFGRVTGWGQDGPLAKTAGHDINYISLTGALHAIGRAGEKPVPPLNLVGDFGGGGMLLAFGLVCALLEARSSGKGQVVDAAMVDGAASLMAMFASMQAMGQFSDQRGTHLLDGGAHFYDTYETKDAKYISIGSIEPQFYQLLIEKAGLDAETFAPQMKRQQWPVLKQRLVEVFKKKTRDEWCDIMEGSDVCFAPILSLQEAPEHTHIKARNTFINVEGVSQPAPAPRFSRTAVSQPTVLGRVAGADTRTVLNEFGFSESHIETLISDQVVSESNSERNKA